VTDDERRQALEAIAAEVRGCTRCRLHEGRTKAVPGEGNPATEVVFVGEGPGFNEDREGRPFVGRAGALLVRLLASIGWRRDEVFITNVVKCRPPQNRDPQPDEIAACTPYLRRQLEVLDPALVVTLGRHSMGWFTPGSRIGQSHGTSRPADPATGAADALVFAMYHPAAALRTPEIERTSFADVAQVPTALLASRTARERRRSTVGEATLAPAATPDSVAASETAESPTPAPAIDELLASPELDVSTVVDAPETASAVASREPASPDPASTQAASPVAVAVGGNQVVAVGAARGGDLSADAVRAGSTSDGDTRLTMIVGVADEGDRDTDQLTLF
jgi:uracil-DNA glycosylase family 4